MQLVGGFLQAGLGALHHDIVQTAICSGFNAGGLPPALLDGSAPSSGCFVAMACSFHIETACHSYVIDFVYALL